MNIVWDFDGTILPLTPYDSEQSLLACIIKNDSSEKHSFIFMLQRLIRTLIIKGIIYADMKNWIGYRFKTLYLRAIMGTQKEVLDRVSRELAARISLSDRRVFSDLSAAGHKQVLISCGTEYLSRTTLRFAGIDHFFSDIIANKFTFKDGVVSGFEYRTLKPEDKLTKVVSMGFQPYDTVVVGDGPTDIPLFNWSKHPVVINRNNNGEIQTLRKKYPTIRQLAEIISHIKNIEN